MLMIHGCHHNCDEGTSQILFQCFILTLQCYSRLFVHGLQTVGNYHSLQHDILTFSESATIMSTSTLPFSILSSLVGLQFEVESVV